MGHEASSIEHEDRGTRRRAQGTRELPSVF
jgi:hypothetical protein